MFYRWNFGPGPIPSDPGKLEKTEDALAKGMENKSKSYWIKKIN